VFSQNEAFRKINEDILGEQVNPSHLSTLAQNERDAVSEFASLLRSRFGSGIRDIILFGSKVRGEGEEFSDIDILIVLTRLTWAIKKVISELAAEENIKYNVLISTVRYDVDTWEKPAIKMLPFAAAVRREGVRL
jgi:predicted nucleotidyltransferase